MLSFLNHHAVQLPRRTLTVIFADKEQSLTDNTWNISVLSVAAQCAPGVADVKENRFQVDADSSVLFFEGLPTGALPVPWADNQHQTAVSALKHLLQSPSPLTLNCFGAGSGAMSALRLAACLGQIPQTALQVNLLLLDPVMENRVGRFPDVSASVNLIRVLGLYAAVRSDRVPIFPDYPLGCEVAEEICPGSHTDIQKMDEESGHLVYLRSLLFLKRCGTPFCAYISFGDRYFLADREIADLENDLTERYQFFVHCGEGMDRENRWEGCARRRQAYIATEPCGEYLNPHHRALADAGGDQACIFSIKKTPLWHFYLRQAALWLLGGIAVACVLQGAGVLALVPVLQTLSPVLGVLAAVSALSFLFFAVWQGLVKPLDRCFNAFPDSEVSLPEEVPPGTYRSHLFPNGLLRGAVRESDEMIVLPSDWVRRESSVQNIPSRERSAQENRSSLRRV